MLLFEFLNVPVELGFSEPYIVLPLWVAMLGICIGVPVTFFACVIFKVFILEPVSVEMEMAWYRWESAQYGGHPMGTKGWIFLPVAFCGLNMWMVEALVFNILRYRSIGFGFNVWIRVLYQEFPGLQPHKLRYMKRDLD